MKNRTNRILRVQSIQRLNEASSIPTKMLTAIIQNDTFETALTNQYQIMKRSYF